ncbi:carboxymuconolactone decarboxylase family protein [Actinacidiphila yeochonensis]|uniref:carboxymuconolactone decarboxylase family protein n=1 Tax=Actinacidiphila yeochonensis TaxID=89050 RepID=UPI000692332D|nr:carboxymuconolactone decarboxylase family protein [Actinacidiphila yeochonensis]
MTHIALDNNLPGIAGLMAHRPDTAAPLGHLANVLLRTGSSTLEPGQRELIAAYVSQRNSTPFCAGSHGAFAAAQLDGGNELVASVLDDPDTAAIDDRMRALLRVAAKVQEAARALPDETVAAAREAGATDEDIHDTVLIAASFCMYNRYVSALATSLPEDPETFYAQSAQRITTAGYLLPELSAAGGDSDLDPDAEAALA